MLAAPRSARPGAVTSAMTVDLSAGAPVIQLRTPLPGAKAPVIQYRIVPALLSTSGVCDRSTLALPTPAPLQVNIAVLCPIASQSISHPVGGAGTVSPRQVRPARAFRSPP